MNRAASVSIDSRTPRRQARRIVLAATAALALAWGSATWGASASDGEPAIMDSLRRDMAAGKRAVIEKGLALTPAEADRFWPVYEDYERQFALVTSRQNRALLDYIQAEPNLTAANARRIASELLRADGDEQRLREKQFRKLVSILPGDKAARYLQLDTRIRLLQRYDMAQQLQLVE